MGGKLVVAIVTTLTAYRSGLGHPCGQQKVQWPDSMNEPPGHLQSQDNPVFPAETPFAAAVPSRQQ